MPNVPPLPQEPIPGRIPDVVTKPINHGGLPPLPDEPLPDRQPDKTKKRSTESSSKQIQQSSARHSEVKENEKKDSSKVDTEDDGWEAVWDPAHKAYYFYNRFTQVTTWTNPRVPSETVEIPNDPDDKTVIIERLKSDPAIQGKSTYEKYKYYQEQLAKRREELDQKESLPETVDTQLKRNHLEISDNNDILRSEKKSELSKRDIQRFKKKQRERKEKKLRQKREWLMN